MLKLRSAIWNIFDIIYVIPLIILFEINSHEKVLSLIFLSLWSMHEYHRLTNSRYYSDLRPFKFNFCYDRAFDSLIYLWHLVDPGLNLFQLEIAGFKHQTFCWYLLFWDRIYFILEVLIILICYSLVIMPLELILIHLDFIIIILIFLSFELNILSFCLFLIFCVISSCLGGSFTILANPFLHQLKIFLLVFHLIAERI